MLSAHRIIFCYLWHIFEVKECCFNIKVCNTAAGFLLKKLALKCFLGDANILCFMSCLINVDIKVYTVDPL